MAIFPATRLRRALVQGLLLTAPLAVSAAAHQVVPIVLTGDPAPGGGTFSVVGFPSLDENGNVAFIGYVSGGGSGVFLASETGVSALRLTGEAAPSGALYTQFTLDHPRALNALGEVAVVALLDDGSSGVFRISSGGDAAFATVGDTAPGTSRIYNGFASVSLSATGDIAWWASLTGGPPSGFDIFGVYADLGEGPVAIANVGDPAPASIGGTYVGLFPIFNATIDSNSKVGFVSQVSGGSAPGVTEVIVLHSAGAQTVLVQSGESLPDTGGGSYFGVVRGLLGLNELGDVAFISSVAGGCGPSCDRGVFAKIGGVMQTLALQGGAIPGGLGQTFNFQPSDYVSPDINNAGDVAFTTGTTGGVFLRPSRPGVTYPLALTGWEAPGTGGGTFNHLRIASINEAGDVAFGASIDGGSGGNGIFLAAASGVPAVGVRGLVLLAGVLLLASLALLRAAPTIR